MLCRSVRETAFQISYFRSRRAARGCLAENKAIFPRAADFSWGFNYARWLKTPDTEHLFFGIKDVPSRIDQLTDQSIEKLQNSGKFIQKTPLGRKIISGCSARPNVGTLEKGFKQCNGHRFNYPRYRDCSDPSQYQDRSTPHHTIPRCCAIIIRWASVYKADDALLHRFIASHLST